MTERPIPFSAPMVRAVLDGTKRQTRRIAKLTSNGHVKEPGGNRRWHSDDPDAKLACPYGQPGDRLWVRETHAIGPGPGVHLEPGESAGALRWPHITYAADGAVERRDERWTGVFGKSRPSIHMHRWASRIALEITGVRLERLHAISEADAIAEGIQKLGNDFWSLYGQHNVDSTYSPKSSFRALWMSINGAESWHENPRVWVVEFQRLLAAQIPCAA
jgi:hypothetical protein